MKAESSNNKSNKTERINVASVDMVDRFNPGKQVYVRAVTGTWSTLRKRIGWVFMLLFILLPWLQWDNRQAILLDVVSQKYHIFGLTIWPQDLIILAALLMTAAFALFFITTYLGRIWCGYTCPQTVWTFIFIWFEEKFEGARNKRIKLDQMPWSFNKFKRKAAKHTAWVVVSFFTATTFISYFVPSHEVYRDIFTLNASGSVYFWIIFFTLATYINAGWMREIMCIHMCPYARFQASMFDKNTYIVGYDSNRGEERGARSRKANPKELGLGDCIDCDLCVQVCPTGIDIRNGLQYECINCGNCIDACDTTMERMGYKKGLISYTSENLLAGVKEKVLRPKLIGYGVVLFVLTSLFLYISTNISPIRIDIIRDRGQLFSENDQGLIENTYTLKILNKTEQKHYYKVYIKGLKEYELYGAKQIKAAAGEVLALPVTIAVDPINISSPIEKITFTISTEVKGKEITAEQNSRFFAP